MPTILVHMEMALLFAAFFFIGSIVWDLDHFIKCSPKNVVAAALTDNKDPAYLAENASKSGCRGFTHTIWFGIILTAIYLGFIIHMVMDTKGGIEI